MGRAQLRDRHHHPAPRRSRPRRTRPCRRTRSTAPPTPDDRSRARRPPTRSTSSRTATARSRDPTAGAWPVLTAPLPVADAAPTVDASPLPRPPIAATTITLTAGGSDDFGIKRVRFADGGTTLGIVTAPPYTPGRDHPRRRRVRLHPHVQRGRDGLQRPDRRSGRSRSLHGDPCRRHLTARGHGDAAHASATRPTKPALAFNGVPSERSRRDHEASASCSPRRARRASSRSTLFLGARRICTLTAAPFGPATSRRPVPTSAARRCAPSSPTRSARPPRRPQRHRRASSRAKLTHQDRKKYDQGQQGQADDPRQDRDSRPRHARPRRAPARSRCTIKRRGRSVLNQQVSLSKSCTFSRSVIAARGKQSFSVTRQVRWEHRPEDRRARPGGSRDVASP